MTQRPKPKPDDPAQSKRFIEAAREVGASDDPKDFEKVFGKVVGVKRGPTPDG